jgi:hypothetical protein
VTDENVSMDVSHEALEAPQTLPTVERPDGVLHDDDALRSQLSAVYDRLEARDERQAKRDPAMPPLPEGSIEDTMKAAADWHEKPKAERQRFAEGFTELEARKAEAKRLGISLEEAEVLRIGTELNKPPPPSEYLPAHQAIQELYPQSNPAEIAHTYAQWDRALSQDFEGTLLHLCEQTGRSVETVLQNLAARARGEPPTPQDAMAAAEKFVADHPDAEFFQDHLIALIQSGKVRRQQDPYATFQAAWDYLHKETAARAKVAAKSGAARSLLQRKSLEEEMAETYERVT